MAKGIYTKINGATRKLVPFIAKRKKVPTEYTELTYISSSGTQYIDLGFVPTVNTRIELVVGKTASLITGDNGIFGNSNYGLRWSNMSVLCGGVGTTSWQNTAINQEDSNTIKLSSTVATYNNTDLTVGRASSYLLAKNAYLFAFNNGTVAVGTNIPIISFKVYTSEVLTMELVAVKRKADSELGMYDFVSKTMLTNSGTGTFIEGPEKPGSRLPEEYQEVEYLQSTGAQYIDSGFKATQDTTIEMDIMHTEIREPLTGNAFFGARNSARTDCFAALSFRNVFCSSYKNYSNIQTSTAPVINTKYNIKLDKNNYYVDLVLLTTHTYGSFTGTRNIYLFGWNSEATSGFDAGQSLIGRIYNCKIADNGTEAKNFVPCYRKADNKPGMYDLVNSEFIVNGGTGEDFTTGPEIIEYTYNAIDSSNSLPSTYQEVEYLESTGVQYIDTTYKANQDTTIEMSIMANAWQTTTGYASVYFGARNTARSDCFTMYDASSSSSPHSIYSAYKASLNKSTGVTTSLDTKYKVKLQKNQVYVDDLLVYEHTYTAFTGTLNVYLFGWNSGGSFDLTQSLSGRIYSNCKIYDDDTLAHHFITCYRKSDNKPGMYDLVSNSFFVNQGTGDDFTVGPDVGDDNYTRIEHAWVWTGTAWVDILA